MARPRTQHQPTMTVKLLRNASPVNSTEGVDALGRWPKGKVVNIPIESAKDMIKRGIASADAAITDS